MGYGSISLPFVPISHCEFSEAGLQLLCAAAGFMPALLSRREPPKEACASMMYIMKQTGANKSNRTTGFRR